MNIEKVSSALYQQLFLRRYPGVARAASKNIPETVLAQDKRLFLLSWLLAQTSLIDDHECLDNLDESKVIQWYSEMGVCNEPDVLMGRVPLEDQIVALRNLLLFIKSVLPLTTQETDGDGTNPIEMYKRFTAESNILPSNLRLTQKLTYNEALRYLNDCRDSLKDKTKSEKPVAVEIEHLTSCRLDSPPESAEATSDSERKERVTKFVESFEIASTWPRFEISDSMSIPARRMDACINSVHSNMTILKETIQSKREISNAVMTEPLEYCPVPLDATIEDIVIGLEELSRWQNSD